MKPKFFYILLLVVLIASACRKEEFLAPDISGATADTTLNIGDRLVLTPNITNLKGNSYTWLVNGKEIARGETYYTFTATEPGSFEVIFRAGNKGGTDERSFKIFVEAPISITLESTLSVKRSNVLAIAPTVSGPKRDDYEYEWAIGDSVIGKAQKLEFIATQAGSYSLTFTTKAGKQKTTANCEVIVGDAAYINNAYTVLEYAPAPGKLHNWAVIGDKSLWDLGFEYPLPYNDFLAKATELRKNNLSASLFVGSWGGSATFKFDHTVANVPGKTDLELTAFYSNRDLPAIYVAYDRNKNGKPDEDEWYEIKNDDYGLEDMPDYEITFTYNKTETDTRRIYVYYNWKDNQADPAQGEVLTNKTFTSSMTYAGTFSVRGFFPGLNMIDINTKEVALLSGWKTSFSRKGKRISRNLTGAAPFFQKLNIDINLAVNHKGESIQLPGVDFVKVQKVVYPFQQDLSTGGVMTDFNMEEGRMLQVASILDKHLKD